MRSHERTIGTTAKERIPVDSVLAIHTDGAKSKSNEFVQSVAESNVQMVVEYIKNDSPALEQMFRQGNIYIVGGMYDVETGRWLSTLAV